MSDETLGTVWLIETPADAYDASRYWNGLGIATFGVDVTAAVRFARREDAERVREWITTNDECRVAEHMWMPRDWDAPPHPASGRCATCDEIKNHVNHKRWDAGTFLLDDGHAFVAPEASRPEYWRRAAMEAMRYLNAEQMAAVAKASGLQAFVCKSEGGA